MPSPGQIITTVGLLCAVLLVTTACGTGKGVKPREDRRDFTLPGSRLTIDARDGDLQVATGTDERVHAERWLTGKAAEKGNASWSMDDDTLRLRTECSGFVLECDFSYRVRVPSGTAITVHDQDGDVTGTGLTGDTTVETGTGNVALRFATAPARVTARSDAGNIAVTVPRRHPAYRLNLHSGAGGVRSQIADHDRAERSVLARTSTGEVRLRAAER